MISSINSPKIPTGFLKFIRKFFTGREIVDYMPLNHTKTGSVTWVSIVEKDRNHWFNRWEIRRLQKNKERIEKFCDGIQKIDHAILHKPMDI